MSGTEFTSSNIAASMDVEKDERPADSAELKELQTEIGKQKQAAKEVRSCHWAPPLTRCAALSLCTGNLADPLLLSRALQGRRTEAVEALLNLEKQHRLAENVTLTKACCLAVLDVLFEAQQWKELNEHILLLAKRRSQLKQASLSLHVPMSCTLKPRSAVYVSLLQA